ncbi:MAG TPA: cytochrome c [Thermoanaerobaculia bacterium]|nr:cytochrome c [Thermoanaerobaculia bacterium]
MQSRKALRWLALVVAVGFAGIGVAALAQEASKQELAARGKVVYRVYCSNCHGASAKGDGPLTKILKSKPADLTTIVERNKGTFPAEAVLQRIDGRTAVPAHGSGDMPVWGLSFQNPEKLGDQEPDVQAKLAQLVAFLESIQAPAKP